jgi:putative ABC transport system substrate-binding protein
MGASTGGFMHRRAFLGSLTGLLARPLTAEAQPGGKLARIGFLSPANASDPRMQGLVNAFRRGMTELGYVEGRTFAIESRWAEGRYDRLARLAAELVGLKVDVILAVAVPAIRAAREATRAIPIVMASVVDPLATGLVTSLAHPGGNVTGLSNMAPDVAGKLLEILTQLVPKASLVAVMWNPDNPGNAPQLQSAETAGRALNMRLQPLPIRTPDDLAPAFAAMARQRADALVVFADIVLNENDSASRTSRWPAICPRCTDRRDPRAGSSPTARTRPSSSGVRPPTWTGSSRGRSPATCRSSRPRGSTSSST